METIARKLYPKIKISKRFPTSDLTVSFSTTAVTVVGSASAWYRWKASVKAETAGLHPMELRRDVGNGVQKYFGRGFKRAIFIEELVQKKD